MAIFRETLNLSQICQINVLPKCDEKCLKSIPKQNLMNNLSRYDNFLFNNFFFTYEVKKLTL